ncbi:MAG: hypothetical protein IM568_06440 [Flavobacterium sp.]|nr:hypothetical protein [Flavobacterium sp.]
MRKSVLLLFFAFLPCLVFSQQWQQYSDSIISNIKKNDYTRATYFIDLADNDINKSSIIKDTIYADYLYRKGVVKYDSGKFDAALFEESLSIWEISEKQNYTKLMKIHYFLGAGYHINLDYVKGYEHYEKCYLINIRYRIPKNQNFLNSIYYLAAIDYNTNLNYKKAENYAQEYINYNKETAMSNYDFLYAYTYKWMDDIQGYENVLLEFNKNYEEGNLKNPELYFKINFLLFENYNKQNKLKGIIKYGEKSVEIYQNSTMNDEKYITPLYSILALVYSEINDDVNRIKYENLSKK